MKLPRKEANHLQHALRYLESEGIEWQIEYGSKHSCITAILGGRRVCWYYSRTSSDRRAGLNFKSQIKRSVERHRQLQSEGAP